MVKPPNVILQFNPKACLLFHFPYQGEKKGSKMIKILMVVFLAGIFFVFWQKWELSKFKVTNYTIMSEKIGKTHRAVVIADLHGFTYGEKNQRLLQKIRSCNPEMILIPGDLMVSKYSDTFLTALEFLKELVKIAPVFYSFGNHETRLRNMQKKNHRAFQKYIEEVEKTGVKILNNEGIFFSEAEKIKIIGLELPIDYYEKGKIVPMKKEALNELLPRPQKEEYNILLAHNPAYAEYYADWGADVTFCGHNHGGLIRIPGVGSLLSPQLTLFPKYDAGRFKKAGKEIIISRGLGTHTFHIRIFNRAELLNIQFLPKQDNNL